jgi:Flp pilus assembly protein TadG
MPRDRGSVTLEVSILGPVLLLVVFTVIQVGLWSYARSLALGAAQEGVAAGRAHGASAALGRERARAVLDATAGDSLRSPSVTSSVSAATLRIEVRGRALSVLPGVPGMPVRQSAEGPIERFTAR